MKGGRPIELSRRFVKDFRGLPPDIRRAVVQCIEDFERDPLPESRRPHSVTPKGQRPIIYTLDVTPNKSHKLSFEVVDDVVIVRRVGTHKQIDRAA